MITDGYQVHHKLGKERKDLTVSGCRIHERWPFVDFIKSVKDSANGSIAAKAYEMITEMLNIDNEFDDLPSSDRQNNGSSFSSEKLTQEPYLCIFLSDGNVPMENNYAEQAIRPFAIGQKILF